MDNLIQQNKIVLISFPKKKKKKNFVKFSSSILFFIVKNQHAVIAWWLDFSSNSDRLCLGVVYNNEGCLRTIRSQVRACR